MSLDKMSNTERKDERKGNCTKKKVTERILDNGNKKQCRFVVLSILHTLFFLVGDKKILVVMSFFLYVIEKEKKKKYLSRCDTKRCSYRILVFCTRI